MFISGGSHGLPLFLLQFYGENMNETRKIIIDCDPGIDDALALLLALKSPEVEVLGITTTAGNTTLAQSTDNAAKVLELAGRQDVPIYRGSDRPLVITGRGAEDTHGSDGLGDIGLQKSEIQIHDGAVDFILDTLREHPAGDVSVIAIGPLSNIARALRRDPETIRRMKELMIMGGAYKSHGNCTPVAEFNVWFDPHAAAEVFENLGRPITMTGLDVTRQVVMTPNLLQMIRSFDNPLGMTIHDMMQFYQDFHWKAERTLGCVVNDPLAIAAFIRPELVRGDELYFKVVTEGDAEGMTMGDPQGILGKAPNVKALTRVDSKGFMRFLLGRLFPEDIEDIDLILNNPVYGVYPDIKDKEHE